MHGAQHPTACQPDPAAMQRVVWGASWSSAQPSSQSAVADCMHDIMMHSATDIVVLHANETCDLQDGATPLSTCQQVHFAAMHRHKQDAGVLCCHLPAGPSQVHKPNQQPHDFAYKQAVIQPDCTATLSLTSCKCGVCHSNPPCHLPGCH